MGPSSTTSTACLLMGVAALLLLRRGPAAPAAAASAVRGIRAHGEGLALTLALREGEGRRREGSLDVLHNRPIAGNAAAASAGARLQGIHGGVAVDGVAPLRGAGGGVASAAGVGEEGWVIKGADVSGRCTANATEQRTLTAAFASLFLLPFTFLLFLRFSAIVGVSA